MIAVAEIVASQEYVLRERSRAYRMGCIAYTASLSSSQILEKSVRRSLVTGPVGEFAPSFAQQASAKMGAAPLAATRTCVNTCKRVVRESEYQERIVINPSQVLNRSDRTHCIAKLRSDFAGKIDDDASGVISGFCA